MATDNLQDFPRILNKPDGETCRVENQDELNRALADGWALHAEPGWMDRPDPANPAAQLPAKPLSPVPDAKAPAPRVLTAPQSAPSVLDGPVAALAAAVDSMTDIRAVQALRLDETKGKNRKGALDVLDARIAQLAE